MHDSKNTLVDLAEFNQFYSSIVSLLSTGQNVTMTKAYNMFFGQKKFNKKLGKKLCKRYENHFWTLEQFFDHCLQDNFRYKRSDVPAQRDPSWDIDNGHNFLGNVFEFTGCPEFVLNKKTLPNGKTVFRVIDGNNRRRVFLLFLNNEITFGPSVSICGKNVSGMSLEEVKALGDEDVIDTIMKLELPVIIFDGITEDEELMVFFARNSTTKLGKAEVRNSIKGFVRNAIIRISKAHESFYDSLGVIVYDSDRNQDTIDSFKGKRYVYADCEFTALFFQYVLHRLEKKDTIDEAFKQKGLIGMYRRNDVDLLTKAEKVTSIYIKHLNNVIEHFVDWRALRGYQKGGRFKIENKGMLIFLLHLIYELSMGDYQNIKITDEKLFAYNLFDGLDPFVQDESLLYDDGGRLIAFTSFLNKQEQNKSNIRTDIVMENLDEIMGENPPIFIKKPRYIPVRLKQKVYKKAQGYCDCCGEHFNIDEGEFHHIIPHSQGGTCDMDNLVFVCVPDHKKIHAETYK